jgi:GYF domain 2
VSDPIHYYLSVDGKRLGPYSAEQIRYRLNQGKSIETDYIWRDGFEEWKYITDVLSELPVEEPPPASEAVIPSSVKFNHPGFPDIPTTKLEIPARGVYEPKVTLSQKTS